LDEINIAATSSMYPATPGHTLTAQSPRWIKGAMTKVQEHFTLRKLQERVAEHRELVEFFGEQVQEILIKIICG